LADEECKIFRSLPDVIQEDAAILGKAEGIDCKKLFNKKERDRDHYDFYKKRKNYYGKYYGFADIVLKLTEYFNDPQNKDKVPEYAQIVVDEVQDFNELENELIDILAKRSPILLAGDDDQCLYAELKGAHPKHIREKHEKYKSFPLSYCSRSTEPIVAAINDFLSEAKARGYVSADRVQKSYDYFPCEKMDKESSKHPNLIFQPLIPQSYDMYFKEEISKIAAIERQPFSVLIIVPNMLKNVRFGPLASALKSSGFQNVNYSEKADRHPLLEATKMMLEEPDSNLAWRIFIKELMDESSFHAIIRRTDAEPTVRMSAMVDDESKSRVLKLVADLKKMIDREILDSVTLQGLAETFGYKPDIIVREKISVDYFAQSRSVSDSRAIQDIPITISTILGSKGRAAEYVFLMDFSDKNFGKNDIKEQNVYDFLVAATRARKRLYLISPDTKEATFLQWINSNRIKKLPLYTKRSISTIIASKKKKAGASKKRTAPRRAVATRVHPSATPAT
jgi:superfamily I DNA/RNA helicase